MYLAVHLWVSLECNKDDAQQNSVLCQGHTPMRLGVVFLMPVNGLYLMKAASACAGSLSERKILPALMKR